MFSRALHVVDRPESADRPSPDGPRHCGQFAAIGAAASRTSNVTREMRMLQSYSGTNHGGATVSRIGWAL